MGLYDLLLSQYCFVYLNKLFLFFIFFFFFFSRFGYLINKVAPFICLVIGSIRSRPSQYYLTA